MKQKFLFIILIIVLGSIAFFLWNGEPVSNLKKEYINSTYKFSLRMPEDFSAREIATEEFHTILLENKAGEEAQGIQILISPFDDVKALTAEMIQRDLPDLKISEPKAVTIEEGYQGLAFKSDNQAFAGASSEIWFVFEGNLYQISTFEKLDDVLQSIFDSWQFKK